MFNFNGENNPDINSNDITKNITNQIIELLNHPNVLYENDPELLNDPSHNLPIYIIDKCYDWIEITLQPIASTSGYFVKNTMITVTIPFSLVFNDVTTLIMATLQSGSLVNEMRNVNILSILSKKKEPKPNLLSPYIEHSEAEIQNIKAKLDHINLFRIKIKNSILNIVNLIIAKLREINDKNKQEKITEFIDALESTKEEKSEEVAKNLFTTFSEVIFGYKSIKNEKQNETETEHHNKGGKLRLFLDSRRSAKQRQRQRKTTRRHGSSRRRQRQRQRQRETTRRRQRRRQRRQ